MKIIKGFNSPPKDYYVYLHRRLDTMEVFYVGKGTGPRGWTTHGRLKRPNSHWGNIAQKHGFYVEIVKDKLQEWYALELEADLISYYGRSDLNSGILCNKSDGGESGSNIIITPEYRKQSLERGYLLGKKVVLNNSICFRSIKDLSRYLIEIGVSTTSFRVTSSSISNCINGRTKTYKDNIILDIDNNHKYESYLLGLNFKSKISDSELIKYYNDYMDNKITIQSISGLLDLDVGYVSKVFSGEYRKHLNFKQKQTHITEKYTDLSEIKKDMKIMKPTELMKKYNMSKTHFYRLKKTRLKE
jgi:hypothetical protein